ncbi:hypothetical protein F511_14203 [Dorcoceras hygrometricum]|uniref:Uncharacterized protein n=1 Tax=Dorcoceras hygrometricum TaxID=472368 RepID=A0A2Z7AAK0_9LAMI|nr:hypothetical protein F511_14203 [Dorcoceras hygrometricum]
MVKEYRKISHTFEKVKAENADFKNSSVEPSTVGIGEADSLQIKLNKMMTENELLRNESSELKAENERLNDVMSSWTKSSVSLNKLQESQKPVNDKSGLGFNVSEISSGETSTQSQLISEMLNKKGKVGIGYDRPESSKSGWLKNKLDKEKEKAGSKSFVQNQQRHGSRKIKSVWKKIQPRRDPIGQNIKPKLNRSHRTSAQTLMDYHTGKNVKVIQVWVPKGVILFGPK